MPPRLVSVAVRMRKRLTQQANSEYLVTWDVIHAATKTNLRRLGLLTRGTKMPSVDWLTRLVRNAIEVRARPPKRRPCRTEKHERQRYETSGKWRRHAKKFWYNGIHGLFDNKKFVIARTTLQKKLVRSTRIRHHLRLPCEGGLSGLVVPKRSHLLLGVPSVEVTACVAKSKNFFGYVNDKPWCGKQAAEMHKAFGKAPRKTYGNLKSFSIVEDGDTQGYKAILGKMRRKRRRHTCQRRQERAKHVESQRYTSIRQP